MKLYNSVTGIDGHWTNYYNGKDVDLNVGFIGKDPTNTCGLMIVPWNGWLDWLCEVTEADPLTCACEHPGQMYLQLRGLCPKSKIDKFYVPRNKKRSGAVLLIGLDTTIIEYEKEKLSWKMNEYSQNVTAVTDASLASFALGSHEWLISNDHAECSNKGTPYRTVLKLTGCKEGEFTCNDGQCIR